MGARNGDGGLLCKQRRSDAELADGLAGPLGTFYGTLITSIAECRMKSRRTR